MARWLFDINLFLGGRRGLRILEVGSGFGDILIYLRSRGCEVLGTDLSKEAAAKGREYGLEMRVGNLADLALPSASFDAAILCHSLEHLPDPRVEIGELARVLRPGGELHLAVPNGRAVRFELDGMEWAHLSYPLHFWYFDGRALQRLLEGHGFELMEPPRTTTRHHALKAVWSDTRRIGLPRALRRFMAFLQASRRRADGGDVLRVVARNTRLP
jgi:SAM-dependent methyltransferase